MQFFPSKAKSEPNRFGVFWSDMVVHEEEYVLVESRVKKFFSHLYRFENLALLVLTTLLVLAVYNVITTEQVTTWTRAGVLILSPVLFFVASIALFEYRPDANPFSRLYHKLMSQNLPE